MLEKTFDQTTFSGVTPNGKRIYGDCQRAALSTFLQRDLIAEGAPHPIDSFTGWWSLAWLDWLETQAITLRYFGLTDNSRRRNPDDHGVPRIVMATGPSERKINHAVIYDRISNSVIHDPHPSRAGLLTINWFVWA